MSMHDLLPLLIFLVIAFLAFYFLETITLFILDSLLRKYWKFVVDNLLRTAVHHPIMIRMTTFGSIAGLVALLFIFTPLAEIFVTKNSTLIILSVILLFTILIIYKIGSRNIKKVVFERNIHLYVFIVFSLISFSSIMLLAQRSYGVYEEIINKILVKPIVDNIEKNYEAKVEDRLLENFRSQIKKDNCSYHDYSKNVKRGLIQFIFVRQDLDLAKKNPDIIQEDEILRGKECVHETKFLLTEEGKWYEVLESKIN